ncbi:MAG: YitT family protein [Prevotellaceae bacterium]|nr:YitT family protein [Prevotellaceae bacterium]MCD8303755.1 YitT family protein [Prevotellaceae bacterium]
MRATIRDYAQILLGLLIYSVGFTCFMLPYGITTGGVSGISALIYYATGFHANFSYLIINLLLLVAAVRYMGWRYTVRTIIATLLVSLAIGCIQSLITYTDEEGREQLLRLIGDQTFMACAIGGLMEGLGLALVFLAGGSTGGTDIIASCVNKYWNISLGRLMLFLDIVIISCSWFVFRSIETMVIGYLTMLISMTFLDYIINGARQSVQFFIISERHEEIAEAVCSEVNRGVTVLMGQGWYSKEQRQVLLIMARKRESRLIFRLIKRIDHEAFVSMGNVEGVFGEGFDVIKR